MKRPQLVSQGSLNRMLQEANEAWNRSDFEQCFDLLERASRLDPANTRILMQLGQSYGRRYDYAGAERCFDKAVRVATRKAEALATAGQLCADFPSHHLAERYYRQALTQKDAPPETFVRLAELCERRRRTEEAAGLVERALHLDANCALALLTQARLSRQAGHLEEAEKSLRPVLGSAQREMRVRGYYELGAVLDRQRRYDEAMTALLEAKKPLAADAPPLLAEMRAVRAHVAQMLATLSADTLRRWSELNTVHEPPLRLSLLCGHPRAGTTLLEQVLDSHPEICSAEETEIFQVDAYRLLGRNLPPDAPMLTVLEGAQTGTLLQARKRYLTTMSSLLGQPVGARLLIDKNPSYNVLIPAFVRIFPETKFLVALRDPRDICLSCFMQAYVPLTRASAPCITLENTVELYLWLMGTWQTLKPLLKNPWLEVRYEDMVENLELSARKTLDFLGVSWNPEVLKFDEHARQKMVRTPTYADVTQPVYKRAVGRWRNYRKYFEPYLEKLEPLVKAFGYE